MKTSAALGDRVRTKLGDVEGVDFGGAYAFLGVPYAKPPVGKLRFRLPEPAEPWQGVRSAIRFGPAAPQPSIVRSGSGCLVGQSDEDCLYLNVWSPATHGPHPVIFWIHGGGYVGGSSAEVMYDGTSLARQGNVVVSFNYRLGTLGGFIYLNELGDPRLAESSNLGIADAVLALRWVNEHIEAFGGNPNCVTMVGQSAGGTSVQTLLGLDAAAGLFHHAIAMSPSQRSARTPAVASVFTELVLEELWKSGISANRIFDAPWQPLQAAAIAVKRRKTYGPLGAVQVPVLDGRFIREQPLSRVKAGLNRNVPLIVGTTRDELAFLGDLLDSESQGSGASETGDVSDGTSILQTRPDDELAKAWSKLFPEAQRAKRMAEVYSAATISRLVPSAPSPPFFLLSDYLLRMHAIALLEAHAHPEAHTFSYLFEWGEPGKGCPHECEIPFMFDTTDSSERNRRLIGKGPHVDRLTATVQGLIASFARTGKTTHESLPEWPVYEPERRATMSLSLEPKIYDDPWREQRVAWEGHDLSR